MPTKAAAASTVRKLDFTNVPEDGGRPPAALVPPGDYVLEVVSATIGKKTGAQYEYVNWQCKIVKGPARGTIYNTTSFNPNSLWSLRQWLKNLTGKTIASSVVTVDFSTKAGLQIGATLSDDEPYAKTNEMTGETKMVNKSKVDATFPASEYVEQQAPADLPLTRTNGAATAQTVRQVIQPEAAAEVFDEAVEEDLAELSVEDL